MHQGHECSPACLELLPHHPAAAEENGEFMPVSWEEALNHIKDQVTMIQTEHGHDAMAVYGSASITNEEAYLLGSSHE